MKRFATPHIAICALVFVSLFFGCNFSIGSDNSMYYSSRQSREPEASASVVREISIIDEPVDEKDDPFKTGDWNKIDYQFNGKIFDSWFFHSSFDDSTVPTYLFRNDNGHSAWTQSNAVTNEWTSASPDYENTAQGYGITGMSVYCYRGKNPLVSANSSYNAEGGRMTRFYFYRIRGSVSIASLDQHLVAVDTYSKFIFAYGKVTATKTLVGKLMPTTFEALDAYAADRGETRGEKRPFYQYDPIGFVKSDGTVVLYKQYRDEMGNGSSGRTNYFPQIHNKSASVAKQENENSSGVSPYLGKGDAPTYADAFLDAMGGKKYEMRQQEKYSIKGAAGQVEGNGMTLLTWRFSPNGKTLTETKTDFVTKKMETTTYTYVSQVDETHATYKKSDGGSVQFSYGDKGGDKRAVLYQGENEQRKKIGELNYKDPGPDFVLRVKGATFKGDGGNTEYTFSADGELSMKYLDWLRRPQQRTYTWARYGNNATEAMYGGYKVRLPDGYNTIEMATTLGSAALIYEWKATRNYTIDDAKDEQTKKFLEAVAGKSYKSRQKENHTYKAGNDTRTKKVYNFKTDAYTFDANGRTLRHTLTDNTDYKEKIPQVTTYTFTAIVDETSAKYTAGGTTVTFKYSGNGNSKLSKDGTEVGDINFKDEGPHFLLRVKGATFEGTDSELYKFSADGATLTLTYKNTIFTTTTATYIWSEPSRADEHVGDIAYYSNWKTRLSDNDRTIEMGTTIGSAAQIYGWKATRK